ncbi:hypothetical protein L914_05461 [Phytophthora nicotianae]|uniref:Uncharacterized protein n=1 Tax=Phytophthora nicotianae TaxID=4792 RepID=W2NPT0_PHYNI|nr:hypothetical protein L914_05461 [Phytophthora nicotianae]
MFKLEPISLERIHALEVKIRDLEELQLAQKRSPSRRDNEMVHLDAITNNNALVNDGQWNVFDTNGFELQPVQSSSYEWMGEAFGMTVRALLTSPLVFLVSAAHP